VPADEVGAADSSGHANKHIGPLDLGEHVRPRSVEP
jgi:hypothetical protein